MLYFYMNCEKSTGTGGYNPAFFHKFFNLVVKNVFTECNRWRSNDKFPDHPNDTYMELSHKCVKPSSIQDFLPIYLFN